MIQKEAINWLYTQIESYKLKRMKFFPTGMGSGTDCPVIIFFLLSVNLYSGTDCVLITFLDLLLYTIE